MSLILGLDTGGTFTDAALLDKRRPFWRHSQGLNHTGRSIRRSGQSHRRCLAAWGGDLSVISRVTLSTTLATNAVVEGVADGWG